MVLEAMSLRNSSSTCEDFRKMRHKVMCNEFELYGAVLQLVAARLSVPTLEFQRFQNVVPSFSNNA